MTAVLQRVEALRASGVLGQLIRFVIVGGLSTVVYAAVYWPLATYVIWPVLASVAGFLVAVVFGYVFHSRWSFQGHGAEENAALKFKFFAVQSAGMVMNAGFTWLLTGPLVHGPTWWPLVPAVLVTPFATFALNRWWVFG
ncbi:GtrA family protein [Sphingomonas sp. HT-1]|uniref:GtrA family protein n=1 Tax=unclassified Sphingomonas TaxID=196159 RepID=UPI000AF0BDF4|nr:MULTISPECIES: GtrA family protein [unclassified Sphingomonas]